MTEYDWIWLKMTECDWLNMTEYDWLNMTEYDQIWTDMIGYD